MQTSRIYEESKIGGLRGSSLKDAGRRRISTNHNGNCFIIPHHPKNKKENKYE